MQLLNNKKRGASGPDFTAWHPNFRNTTELPDTKTVRTKFFATAGCVAAALAALLYLGFTEYTLHDLNKTLDGWQQSIDKNSKPSREAAALYKKFKDEEAKSAELTNFVAGEKLVFSDFLAALGQSLPDNVVLTAISYRESDVSLRGIVKGPPELASGTAAAYEKRLRDSAEINSKFSSISVSNLSRDSVTGYLNFEIALKFKK